MKTYRLHRITSIEDIRTEKARLRLTMKDSGQRVASNWDTLKISIPVTLALGYLGNKLAGPAFNYLPLVSKGWDLLRRWRNK
ncbi:MAG: hypothetical protein V4543_10090 [Bacteroidota bacterium]